MYELFFDILILSYVALFLGFLVDFIIPFPDSEESFTRTFILVWVQIIIDSLICIFVGTSFEYLVGRDPDYYYAFTVFTVVFFLVQTQLFVRLDIIYRRLTGRSLEVK